MKVSTLFANGIYQQNANSAVVTDKKTNNENYKNTSEMRDTIEISAKAYHMQAHNEQISATSGKDTLKVTKGNKENTYIIHFSDSAIVSRTISRGYITVNGTKIDLSDKVRKQLQETDKRAETDRMQAYSEYIMQHELAVAQQQSEAYRKLSDDASRAILIMARIQNGEKISSSEEKELMQFNPQLYAMAKNTAAMAKNTVAMAKNTAAIAKNTAAIAKNAVATPTQHYKQVKIHKKEDIPNHYYKYNNVQGVEWSQFEWKTYESQMTVSLEDTVEIQGISENSVTLNNEKHTAG